MKETTSKKIKAAFIALVLMALIIAGSYLAATLFLILPRIVMRITIAVLVVLSFIYLYKNLYRM